MTISSISTSLANSAALDDPHWLHMELVNKVNDGMTVAMAAAIIDETYGIGGCGDIAEVVPQEEATTEKNFSNAIYDLPGSHCMAGGSSVGDSLVQYDVEIKVFRSHRKELYKLQMSNGHASPPYKQEGRVVHTIDVEDKSHVTLNNPILSRPVVVWQNASSTPKIHIKGNTLFWDGLVTGTIRAEFGTEWDQVMIHVTGDHSDSSIVTGTDKTFLGNGWYSGNEQSTEISDYGDVQCEVLAFYHYQYESIVLNKPEEDDSISLYDMMTICKTANLEFKDSDDDEKDQAEEARLKALAECIEECNENAECISKCEKDFAAPQCQRHVNESVICHCGGKEESNSHYEVVPCPRGVRDGTTLKDGISRITYKDCGYRDEANDPDVYDAKCCEKWPFEGPMPNCKSIVKQLMNKSADDGLEQLEDQYPEGTIFVFVGPEDGSCGEWTIEQVLHEKKCCEDAVPLVEDTEHTEYTIGLNDSAAICVTGGSSVLTWKASGGYTFDNGLSEAEITLKTTGVDIQTCMAINSTDGACGDAKVTITDDCGSSVKVTVDLEGEGVAELKWSESSSTVIAPGESAVAVVENGRPPYVFNVSNGFFADGATTAKTTSRSVIVYVAPDSCGIVKITVSDACNTSVNGSIRNTNGYWKETSGDRFLPLGLNGAKLVAGCDGARDIYESPEFRYSVSATSRGWFETCGEAIAYVAGTEIAGSIELMDSIDYYPCAFVYLQSFLPSVVAADPCYYMPQYDNYGITGALITQRWEWSCP